MKHLWIGFKSGANNVTRIVRSETDPNDWPKDKKTEPHEFFKGPFTLDELPLRRSLNKENWIKVKEWNDEDADGENYLRCPHCGKWCIDLDRCGDWNESYKLHCPECDYTVWLNTLSFVTLNKLQFPVVVIQGKEHVDLVQRIQQLEEPINKTVIKTHVDESFWQGSKRAKNIKSVVENTATLVKALEKIASAAPLYDGSVVFRAIARNALKEIISANEDSETVEPGFVVEETVDMGVDERVDSPRISKAVGVSSGSGESGGSEVLKEESWYKGQPVCPDCNNVYVDKGVIKNNSLCSCDCLVDEENDEAIWVKENEWVKRVASKTVCSKCGKLPKEFGIGGLGCLSHSCKVTCKTIPSSSVLIWSPLTWVKQNQNYIWQKARQVPCRLCGHLPTVFQDGLVCDSIECASINLKGVFHIIPVSPETWLKENERSVFDQALKVPCKKCGKLPKIFGPDLLGCGSCLNYNKELKLTGVEGFFSGVWIKENQEQPVVEKDLYQPVGELDSARIYVEKAFKSEDKGEALDLFGYAVLELVKVVGDLKEKGRKNG